MVIRYRLDELLRVRHMTAKALSQRTGIAVSTLSEIRRNKAKQISNSTIDRICAALDCAPGDLIVRVESAPPDSPVSQVAE